MFSKRARYKFGSKPPKNVLNSQSFSIRYGKNDGSLKIAVVVSKKIDKRAVARNKIERKLLNILKKIEGIEKEPLDLIFYVKKNALENQDLDREVNSALDKLKI